MNVSIFKSGLLLVSIPLFFQLSFIGLVTYMQERSADDAYWSLHTKEVIGEARSLLMTLMEAEAGSRDFILTGNPIFRTPFVQASRTVPETVARLRVLVRDNPEQTARAAAIEDKTDRLLKRQREDLSLLGAGRANDVSAKTKSLEVKKQMDGLRGVLTTFIGEEKRLEDERQTRYEASQIWTHRLLVYATILSLTLTLFLAAIFNRGIARRLVIVTENTRRLTQGKELIPPLSGDDEITALDRAFRNMARELARSTESLRCSAEEIGELYNRAPCGYHAVGPDGTIVSINETELGWLGYTRAEVLCMKKLSDLMTPESRDKFEDVFPQFKQEGSVSNLEYDLVRKNGTTLPVLLNSTAVYGSDGSFLSSRSTVFDITRRKKTEAEIRRLNEELEQRVLARTAELQETNRDLAQKNQENETFVYSVSHDLRSPLVNLQGFSRELDMVCKELRELLMANRLPEPIHNRVLHLLDGEMSESTRFIQTAVTRLSGIIDSLLRLSRAGRVEYQSGTVDLNPIISRIIQSMNGTIAEHRATVTVENLPSVWGDAPAMEQIFANLIGNALKYLDPKRPGLIQVGAGAADNGSADFRTFFVKDNGLGIPKAHQNKIFQAFQRCHPEIASGEGMGLAIVYRIVERHRGKVWVESTGEAGSVFFVSLPVKQHDETCETAQPSGEDRNGHGTAHRCVGGG